MFAYPSLSYDRLASRYRAIAALVLAAVFVALLPLALRAPAEPTVQRSVGMPLLIMPTDNTAAPFSTVGMGGGVAFQPDGLSLTLASERLAIRFIGARPEVTLEPTDRRAGTISRQLGAPAAWRDQIPTYAALTYRGLFPGIDLRYDGQASQLKGTYTVAPHASPAAISWRYEGAESLTIDPATGDMLIGMASGGTLREDAPVAWQDLADGRVPVAVSYRLADGVASFSLGAYDPAQPLVIDPILRLGTYLGGGSADYGRGVAVDSQGFIYLVGEFFSSDFLGDSTPTSGSTDVIVLKLTPDGSELVYGWYAGGSGSDTGLAITVNSAGEAFVLVDPDSADFPLLNAPIDTAPEVGDGILMKMSATGQPLYTTYLGFAFATTYTGKAIAASADGKIYITGQTYIATRRLAQLALVEVNPTTGAVVRSFDRGERYITSDGAAVAIGPDKRIYLTGTVSYPFGEFPTTPDAFQKQCGAKLILGEDKWCVDSAYLMVFSPDLQVEYASYLGGSANDRARGLAVDGQGNAIIVGDVGSKDFPLKNALLPACPSDPTLELCSYDGFATKLSLTAGLIYSTYITSPSEPEAMTFTNDVVVDAAGNAYVAGFSSAANLPVKDAVQPTRTLGICPGFFDRFCFDAYVIGLAPNGSLHFGTYLGGAFDEYTQDIAIDNAGAIYLTGYTDARDFPTTAGSIQPSKSANYDFFAAKIGLDSGPTPDPELPDPELPDPELPGSDLPYKAYVPLLRR